MHLSSLYSYLLLLVVCSACRTGPEPSGGAARASDGRSAPLAARVQESLERAGRNRSEVQAYLNAWDGAGKNAAEFLVANMPTVDLVSLTSEDLVENQALAMRARNELSWGRDVPENVFLHYVLPHRVTQEAHSAWRGRFCEELWPLLAQCTNMVDAALVINRWCGQRVGFKQTEFRDQNALSTLKAGYGRCEEMMIFCIDAMRAAGIPARPCSTPWWATNDNNHAWVEVWADGDWYYLGGCEPGDNLDQAWFTGPARRAGMVVSTMYGKPDGFETGDRVYRVNGNTSYINSTAVYAMTGELDVMVTDSAGQAVADCPVSVSVFNFGGLRALTQRRTDGEGRTRILVGMGEFFVSAGADGAGRAYQVAASVPAGTTPVELELKLGAAPQESFWLRFPTTQEAARLAALRPKGEAGAAPSVRPELASYSRPSALDPALVPELVKCLGALGEEDSARAHSILVDALDNWRSLAAALTDSELDERRVVVEFLQRTTHLDRLELDTDTITDHVRQAQAGRRPAVVEELWLDFVLKAGVDNEHLGVWREELSGDFAACHAPDHVETARRVHARLAREIGSGSRGRLGPLMNPGQVWHCGAGTAREVVILGVGVLRALGVPARRLAHEERVEFHTGSGWGSFDPRSAGDFVLPGGGPGGGPETQAGQAAAAGEAGPGRIELVLSRAGVVDTGFRGWDVARFSGGSWAPLRNVAVQTEGDSLFATVPAGEYLVTAGVRNGNGDAWVRTALLEVEAGGVESIAWELDPPAGAGVFGLPMVRTWPGLVGAGGGAGPGLTTLVDRAGDTWQLSGEGAALPLLLVLFSLDNEPSIRMLPLLEELAPEMEQAGCASLAVLLPSSAGVELPAELASLTMPLAAGSAALGEALGLGQRADGSFAPLPSIVLLAEAGEALLWTEGYDLGVAVLIREALERMGAE
ncbi:MAG TPA: transglutaminase-like domain-containing protein [Planctomycetota bacterium]|nr:transglutaminase-like domain-containing protein [Planctomycetota bacterium]